MATTVREVDAEKVKNTKEDIDTLLVFVRIAFLVGFTIKFTAHRLSGQAGLFSAVVTTFVIAVYPSLQPSDNDEIVFLLRQSLTINYTMSNGFLNSTVPFPTTLPFEAPLWALRVNGLWFASLIVSLSTASIGMLVKQWLTE